MAKISEIIKKLQEMQEKHGDLPLAIQGKVGGECFSLDICYQEYQPGFLFEQGRPERIVIEGE